MKRKTSKHRRHSRQSVLRVRVMSPRIAWFGFLRFTGTIARFAAVIALLAGIGWGTWRGIQHAFYKNPDFRLQVIDLNANPAVDEPGVAQALGIDLSASPSLFDVEVKSATRKLLALPGIADARVERHLPGTLMVRVIPRTPKAWISCPESGLEKCRRAGAMLVDPQGVAYPCPERQLELAAKLPVIELPPSADQPILSGRKIRQPELANCTALLDAACQADPEASHWIESIRQVNDWSLRLVTRQGTTATFSLGDHARQIANFRTALDHAGEKGYGIATINLIPKHNIPVTLRGDDAPPKAIPVSAGTSAPNGDDQRSRDLTNLLNRN